jgi:hypothetical protein
MLPCIVATEHPAMKAAQNEVGAARPDLVVAIKPWSIIYARRKLEAEYHAGRHVREKAGVDPHDFKVAEVMGIEGLNPPGDPVSVVRGAT